MIEDRNFLTHFMKIPHTKRKKDTKSDSQLLALASFVFRDKILKHIHTH